MALTLESCASLNNGGAIPWLGLGVFRSAAGRETEETVQLALEIGYRHFDTAAIYGNEQSVGAALRASGRPRHELFVTTKLWRDEVGYDSALRAIDTSLGKLGLSYVDLYLIHWPTPSGRLDAWRALERILAEGKARAIGVSNYMPRHLQELLAVAHTPPAVNQIELSPYNYTHMQETVLFCRQHGILVEAYSPLTKGRRLQDPRLLAIAGRYGKSPAQVLIRYILQKGIVALPKSTNPNRLHENAAVFDFTLSEADMARLDSFNENLITGWDPTHAP